MSDALRTEIEDGIIALLRPLLVENKGGYLKAVAPYQGPIEPDPEDENLSRVLNGRTPAVLVTTGDSEFGDVGMMGRLVDERIFVHTLCCESNFASQEKKARGSDAGSSPGLYKIMQDVRERLQAQSPAECAEVLVPTAVVAISRGDLQIWRIDWRVDTTSDLPDLDADDAAYTSKTIEGNLPDTAEPTVNPITDIEETIP